MELDDSMQSSSRHTPTYRPVQHNLVSRLGLQLFSIITFPLSISLSIVTSLLHFVFRVLRVPFPRSWNSLTFTAASARNRNRGRPLLADDPSSVADRFVRELEDETGAMCVSRAAAVANEEGNGNAGLEKSVEGRGRLLPDFWIGSYESALKAAEAQSKVLCVILLSEEHDDVPEFRRWALVQNLSQSDSNRLHVEPY
jgi:FAS-associated factor 2